MTRTPRSPARHSVVTLAMMLRVVLFICRSPFVTINSPPDILPGVTFDANVPYSLSIDYYPPESRAAVPRLPRAGNAPPATRTGAVIKRVTTMIARSIARAPRARYRFCGGTKRYLLHTGMRAVDVRCFLLFVARMPSHSARYHCRALPLLHL